jgi:hypothetical protein
MPEWLLLTGVAVFFLLSSALLIIVRLLPFILGYTVTRDILRKLDEKNKNSGT